MGRPQRIARAGPSKIASTPSPVDLIFLPRWRSISYWILGAMHEERRHVDRRQEGSDVTVEDHLEQAQS